MVHHLSGCNMRILIVIIVFEVSETIMLLMICVCLVLFLFVPVVVAILETRRADQTPDQLEFWTFARSIGARCHVPVGKTRTPLIIKDTVNGSFRMSASKGFFGRWKIEARVYMAEDFCFAGRLCTPGRDPLKWRTPGMSTVALFHDEVEHLPDFSVESSDEPLVRWLLRHPKVRSSLTNCLGESNGETMELILANRMVVGRVLCPRGWGAGDSIDQTGHVLFSALMLVSSHLRDLHEAMLAGKSQAAAMCEVCSQTLDDDPYTCASCGARTHRGCREMLGGCHSLACTSCPDYLPPNFGESLAEAS